MPSVTARASTRLIEDRKRRGLSDNYKPRLSRRDGRIVLEFATQPAAEDSVATTQGLNLFVARDVADDLNGVVIDLQSSSGSERLVLLKGRRRSK
jgi:Fe-S cluster assembly iron-binding protein IscA